MFMNSLIHRLPKPLSPKPLSPKPLSPKPLSPKPLSVEETPHQSAWIHFRHVPHLARMNAEMLLLFAILLVIDHGWFGGQAFDGLAANPYWVPVLTMAVGYGSGMGVAAAIIATVIWITAPHTGGSGNDIGNGDHLQQMLSLSVLPMLWMVVALAVGELTTSRTEKVSKLASRARLLDSDLKQMGETIERLAQTNRSLQVRIATQENTVGRAIAAALDLVDKDKASQIHGVERLIALAAQTEDFTFYGVDDRQFVTLFCGRSASSQPDDLSWADLADSASNHLNPGRQNLNCQNLSCQNLSWINGHSEHGRPDHGRTGNLALPVYRDGNEDMIGVLAIKGLPRSELTESKLAELADVAQSIGRLSDTLFDPVEYIPVAVWPLHRSYVT
ncbi:MAG: MASE1 domain-containing protein [Novosphingobium sp.]